MGEIISNLGVQKQSGVSQVTKLMTEAAQRMDAKYNELSGVLGALVESPQFDIRIYQSGMIADSSDAQAHAVYGAIYQKYVGLGREGGFLGYPLTDETGTPDGVGRFNRFEHGMIYWTPDTSAHEIHGAILALWESMGFETSFLGYPTTDETAAPDAIGRFNNFQHGTIYWSPTTGAFVVPSERTWDSGPLVFGDGTALGGNCQVHANNNGDVTFSGHMHDSGFDTYDYGVAAILLAPNGNYCAFSYQGRAEGTNANLLGSVRRDDDWTRANNFPSLRDNWSQFSSQQTAFKVTITTQDKLAGSLSDLTKQVQEQMLDELAQEGVAMAPIILIALL